MVLVCLVGLPRIEMAASNLLITTSVTRCTTIVVAKVMAVTPSIWTGGVPERRTLEVQFRLTDILRDANKQHPALGIYTVVLPQERWPHGRLDGSIAFWSDKALQTGQTYIVFTNARLDRTARLFEVPEMVEPVTDNVNAVSEIEWIVKSMDLPLTVQARSVARLFQPEQRSKGRFLAEYAAGLLAFGTDSDTVELAQVLETKEGSAALSSSAQQTLLWELFQRARSVDVPPANLLRVFDRLVARNIEEAGDTTQIGLSALQVNILQNYVPWIAKSERASSMMKISIPFDEARRLRLKVDKLEQNRNISVEQREALKQFRSLIPSN